VVQGTRVIVDQLAPFTNYSFYVRSYNARSKSRPSAVVTRCTEEDGQFGIFPRLSGLFMPPCPHYLISLYGWIEIE